VLISARTARTANRFAPRQERGSIAAADLRSRFGPSLLAWYDASTSPVAFGSTAETWSDSTGIANATQALASKQPARAVKNNVASMQFDGVNDGMVTAATSWPVQAVTVFTVRWLTDASNKNIFERTADFNASTEGLVVYGRAAQAGAALKGNVNFSGADYMFAQDKWTCNAAVFNKAASAGSEIAIAQDGALQTLTVWASADNTNTFGSQLLSIGGRNGGASFAMTGWLASVVVLSGARTAAEIASISQLLLQRAGVA
jgi:hypothetical protein